MGVPTNSGQGVVCHSMVGYLGGAMTELDNLLRRASWHFSVLQNGVVLQHYDSAAVTWHCGSEQGNGRLIGIEHEGGFDPVDEPLTDAQRNASVALVHWLAGEHGFPLVRGAGLFEHNEVAPPTDATNCPSHRIPWDAYLGNEARMYTDAQLDTKFMALFVNAVQNGADILVHGAQIAAIARAFAAHVQAGGTVPLDPAFQIQLAAITKRQADLEARVKAAALASLAPPA